MQHMLDMETMANGSRLNGLGEMAHRVLDRMNGKYGEEDTFSWALLAKILNFAAEAEHQLEQQQLRIAELEAMSTTDELTGLANRRGLDDFLCRALAMARRHEDEGLLLFIDLDEFKSINDTYGHDVGDTALKTVAHTLTGLVRSSDLVARIGGDEFVAVLTRCPATLAPDQAARLEAALTKVRVRHGRRIIPVSASVGYAVFGPGSDATDLLSGADKMMYANKARRQASNRR